MDNEKRARMTNPQQSKSARQAWKKYGTSYRRGIRKKERKMDSKINQAKEKDNLKNLIPSLKQVVSEAEVIQNNQTDLQYKIAFDNIPGGLALGIDPIQQSISLSFYFDEDDNNGMYKNENEELTDEDFKNLYKELTSDIHSLAESIDSDIKGIFVKHGLRPVQ